MAPTAPRKAAAPAVFTDTDPVDPDAADVEDVDQGDGVKYNPDAVEDVDQGDQLDADAVAELRARYLEKGAPADVLALIDHYRR